MFELKIPNKNTHGLDLEEDKAFVEKEINRIIHFISKKGWCKGYRNALAVELGIITASLGLDGEEMMNLINEALISEKKIKRLCPMNEEMSYCDPGDRIGKVTFYAKDWITVSGSSVVTADFKYGIKLSELNDWDGTKYVSIEYFD